VNPASVAALAQAQQQWVATLCEHPGPLAEHTLDALPGVDGHDPLVRRGWIAYRANGHAMAENSLQAAYPVVAELLGTNTFKHVAHDLWHQHPPTRGDLAQWGSHLPDWLGHCQDLAGLPYLADVARAEWALHLAATASDALPDPASFARLTQEDPAHLGLRLGPGTALVASRFPLASLILAHRPGGPAFELVAHQLRQGVAETALVWRQGLAPRLTTCTPPEAALLTALLGGADLLTAVDAAASASSDTPFDFTTWLHDAVSAGLVVGVHDALSPTLSTERSP
jgi:hypothetical protein